MQQPWCILHRTGNSDCRLIMFSKACEYALRATIFLAQKSSEDHKLGVDEIARGIDAPRSFAAKILQQLNQKQVISSMKGPTGGFYLTQKSRLQPVWRVLQAFDEDQRLTSCVMGLHKCNDKKTCPLHSQYKAIREPFVQMFQQRSIAELADTMEKTKAFVKHQ